ncbi:unnamed protein product [Leptidea sinapis]|uniref:Uncharacterized protein n=1 Tax=Leptidea sinapis TaxID=189913 RepID=A0A5E4PPC4_9NEOP|nr:unnamed protein product [Leptidea sinapis]
MLGSKRFCCLEYLGLRWSEYCTDPEVRALDCYAGGLVTSNRYRLEDTPRVLLAPNGRMGLNYALVGLRPWWWHACNVILHAACCALVARSCVTIARLKRPFAALAALLFAVHPVHTEAVAGVVGRADVLACVFFLSSLLAPQ